MSQVTENNANGNYNALPLKVQDRDEAIAELNGQGPGGVLPTSLRGEELEFAPTTVELPKVNTPQVAQYEAPELFRNLRTVLLGRDVGSAEKLSAAKALLHNYKTGSKGASSHAESMLLDMLTHERMRGF